MDMWTLLLVVCSPTVVGDCEVIAKHPRPMPIEECMMIVNHAIQEPRRTHTFVCSLTNPYRGTYDEKQ